MFKETIGSVALYWGTFIGVFIGIAVGVYSLHKNMPPDVGETATKLYLLSSFFAMASARYFLRQNIEPYIEASSNQRAVLPIGVSFVILLLNTTIVVGYSIVIAMISQGAPIILISVLLIQTWAALGVLIATGYWRLVFPKKDASQKGGLLVLVGDAVYVLFASMIFGIFMNGDDIQHLSVMLLGMIVTISCGLLFFECMSSYFSGFARVCKETISVLKRYETGVALKHRTSI